MSSNKIRKM